MDELFTTLIHAWFDMYAEVASPPPEWLYLTTNWTTITKGTVSSIYDYIRFFGIGLTLVYFLMELNQKLGLEGRDLTMKSFFAPFLKLMIAFATISQSGKIVGWILQFNDNFVKKMAESPIALDISELEKAIVEAGEAAAFFTLIFVALIALLGMLVALVLQLVWGYKAIMYKIEVLFRVSLLPIAVADVYNGNHSNAIKYIKGFLVLGIVAVSFVTLPELALEIAEESLLKDTLDATATELEGISLWSFFTCLGNLLVAPFAAIAGTGIVKQLAKEALN